MQVGNYIANSWILALAGLLLCACAKPYVQPEGETKAIPALYKTYALMDDGYRLPLKRWIPKGDCLVQVLALHGLNDYRNAFKTRRVSGGKRRDGSCL